MSMIIELGDEEHALLEPPVRTYTSTAVQRAFLVWTVLGHVNQFRDVCDYFQRLEYLEESFTPEQRKESRDHEYSLLTKEPPKSPYLLENFPFLYPTNKVQYRYPDEMKRGCMSFNDQGWNNSADRDEASTVDIIRTSHLIRNYCIAQKINIRNFLAEFQKFTRNHSVNPTVSNLASYIQHRNVQQERQLVARYQAFDTRFLNSPPNQSYTDLDPLPQNKQMNHQPNYDFVPENTHRRIPSNSQQYNQTKVGIPLAVQQAKKHFYSDAGVNKNVAANSQLIKSAVNMPECGIDDVLNNITNINNAYARKISTSNEMPIKIKNYLAEDENNTHRLVPTENKVFVTLPPNQLPYFNAYQTASPVNVSPYIFYYPYLLDTGIHTKDELPEKKSNLVFSMKNKNLPVPIIAPTKKPSYSKVKSKRSKSAAKKTDNYDNF